MLGATNNELAKEGGEVQFANWENYATEYYSVVTAVNKDAKSSLKAQADIIASPFEKVQRQSLAWAFKPLIACMKVFGMLHRRKPKRLIHPSIIYSALILVIVWFNVIRMFWSYSSRDKYGSRLFMKVILHGWYLQVAFTSSIFFHNVSPGLALLLKRWDDFIYDCFPESQKQLHMRFRRYAIRAVLAALAFVLFITGLVIITLTSPAHVQFANRVLAPIVPYVADATVVKVVFALFSFILSSSWAFPMIMIVLLCFCLRIHFLAIKANIANAARAARAEGKVLFVERFRRRHQRANRLVRQLDSIISLYNLIVYLTSVPLMCFSIYNFMSLVSVNNGEVTSLIMTVGQLLPITVHMGLLTAAAALLASAASSPKETLFDVALDNPGFKAFQISVFLQKLTQDHLGLTAWNLFNINKRTILMVATMVMSYVLVLLKLGLSLGAKGEDPHHFRLPVKNISNIMQYSGDMLRRLNLSAT